MAPEVKEIRIREASPEKPKPEAVVTPPAAEDDYVEIVPAPQNDPGQEANKAIASDAPSDEERRPASPVSLAERLRAESPKKAPTKALGSEPAQDEASPIAQDTEHVQEEKKKKTNEKTPSPRPPPPPPPLPPPPKPEPKYDEMGYDQNDGFYFFYSMAYKLDQWMSPSADAQAKPKADVTLPGLETAQAAEPPQPSQRSQPSSRVQPSSRAQPSSRVSGAAGPSGRRSRRGHPQASDVDGRGPIPGVPTSVRADVYWTRPSGLGGTIESNLGSGSNV